MHLVMIHYLLSALNREKQKTFVEDSEFWSDLEQLSAFKMNHRCKVQIKLMFEGSC